MKKFLKLMILVLCSIVVSSSFVLKFIEESEDSSNLVYLLSRESEDVNYYHVSDNLYEKAEQEYLKNMNSWKITKDFYAKLENMDDKYSVVYFQPVILNNLKVDQKFYYGYEDGDDFSIFGDKPPLKAIELNYQSYEIYDFESKIDGYNLSRNDFIFDGGVLPIVLGSEYKSVFDVGDEIEIEYLFKNHTVRVVAFFNDDASITSPYSEIGISLNRFILFPAYSPEKHEEKTESGNTFEDMHYLFLTGGSVVTKQSWLYTLYATNDLAEEVGFPRVDVFNYNGDWNVIYLRVFASKTALIDLLLKFTYLIIYISTFVMIHLKRRGKTLIKKWQLITGYVLSILCSFLIFLALQWFLLDGLYINAGCASNMIILSIPIIFISLLFDIKSTKTNEVDNMGKELN